MIKYTKAIIIFIFINILLIFSMIFIANKSRELEKDNSYLSIKIEEIKENIKINKIELITHKNNSYLEKLYSLYFNKSDDPIIPNILSLNQLSKKNKNIELVKTNH